MNSKTVLQSLRQFLTNYCHFKESDIALPISLWIAATYIFEAFDAFPYLVVTARVKRAGKTRLGAELVGFTARVTQNVAACTGPSLMRMVKELSPTLIWDEAETLSSEAASVCRAFLNVGYRKGQTIPRATKDGVTQWPTYCPKVFILIGDVYDTLRDRSIIIEMERGEQKKQFFYETAKQEGSDIAEQLKSAMADNIEKITQTYYNVDISFLGDREAEIWRPIFTLCQVFEPENIPTLQRIAADMAADKTNPFRYTEDKEASQVASDEEYSKMLLRDIADIITGKWITQSSHNYKFNKAIPSAKLLEIVKEIPTSPWRRYHSPSEARHGNKSDNGSGLTIVQMCYMLERFGLRPDLNRVKNQVFRGYKISAIETAAKKFLS